MNALDTTLTDMRNYFSAGHTLPASFRIAQLKKLKASILQHEQELYAALYTDLKKSPEECWVTELGMVIAEINYTLKHIRRWMKPRRKGTNLLNFPSRNRVIAEPLGVVLIIGPWNYPFQLLINPLVGAVAAGNVTVLKPSENAPATDAVMKKMIEAVFPPEYIYYVQGEGKEVIPALMQHFTFNHIFYTGNPAVGKIIYSLAAEKLTPVTLELGGKSPCVVDADAALHTAAKRITMTKFSNAGQMCVAPDYVLVHESVKDKFIGEMIACIRKFFGEDPSASYQYGKMINERQFDRVAGYLKQGKLLYGGQASRDQLFIAPALLTDLSFNDTVMQEEIFGPVLPVISFKDRDEALSIIRQHPDPLAFYIFTRSNTHARQWLQAVPSGGACVNNASWHLTNYHLPFGGRGNSGTGHYHGRYSFETFSHRKAVMKTPTWFDPAIKYPPLKGKLGLFRKLIR